MEAALFGSAQRFGELRLMFPGDETPPRGFTFVPKTPNMLFSTIILFFTTVYEDVREEKK